MRKVAFAARIEQEGVNPYIDLPQALLKSWGKKGTLLVQARIGGQSFQAHLMPLGVKRGFKPGEYYRLFLNLPMRQAAKKKTGDRIRVVLSLDLQERKTPMVPALAKALRQNAKARKGFEGLSPSHQKEILRYLGFLKSEEALERNIVKVVEHLTDPNATWFGKRSH